ncbi:MAG TPA: methylhydantoinase, partial [Deltaproteobacteria bacterium]|nr:methylhydantoinase [Deltaproteobacteria bacterium]
RIPVIDMVEIGAGGGSIANVDDLKRIAVGPESAGSAPGPACYGNGGAHPTVTDADLHLGRIDAQQFSGGRITLDVEAANVALAEHVGNALELSDTLAAFGISEVVDENMA